MKTSIKVLLGLLSAIALFYITCVNVIEQEEFAVVYQFSKPVKEITTPGILITWPFETVSTVDNRLQIYDSPAQDIITGTKQTLSVDSFALFRISGPIEYSRQINTKEKAKSMLDDTVYANLRNLIGNTPYETVVSDRDNLMEEARKLSDEYVRNTGLQITLVMLKKVDLPTENMNAVMGRMISDCLQRAEFFRADGLKSAQGIKAFADYQVARIRSQADWQKKQINADGESEAAQIYNDAYGANPQFYGFMKSLETARVTLEGKDVRVLLNGDQDYLKAVFGKN